MNRTSISQDLSCDGFGNSEVELYNILKCVDAYTERLIKASLSYVPRFIDTDILIHTQLYNACTRSYMRIIHM